MTKHSEALVNLTRINQWWDFKLPLPIAIAFAYAACNQVPADHFFPAAGTLLLSGVAAAFFASIINDLTDLEEDRKAGKNKAIANFSPTIRIIILLGSIASLIITAYSLHQNILALCIFLAIALTFTLYSVKPIRLKSRGMCGAFSIALGEHLLPACLALALLTPLTNHSQLEQWLAATVIWSTAFGLRGIIWHQLNDLSADKANHCNTAALALGPDRLVSLANKAIFPCELVGLAAILMLSKSWIVFFLLFLHWVVEFLHYKYMGANLIVVRPQENARFILFEYYQLFFPIAMLAVLVQQDSKYYFCLLAFLLLFLNPVLRLTKTVLHLTRWRLIPALRRLPQGKEETFTLEQFERL